MTGMILEFLSNLLKVGKEQFFLKGGLLRDKVPIKPVLGLTGLGVLFMAVRPLLGGSGSSEQEIESTIVRDDKPKITPEWDLHHTLKLMKEKELELKKKETANQKS